MRRREFIAGLGAAAWPLAARAQQQTRMPRIGVFSYESENDIHFQEAREEFTARLHELGWIEGRNIRIDYRFADNDVGRLHTYAQELSPCNLMSSSPPRLRRRRRSMRQPAPYRSCSRAAPIRSPKALWQAWRGPVPM
jgi:hypothetical protein